MSLLTRLRALFNPRSTGYAPELPDVEMRRPKPRAQGAGDAIPRFRTTATDRPELDGRDEVRLRLREAFMPSQPVTSRAMFAGRLPLVAHLIEAVEDQRAHVVLYGERGIGKTSLLKVFSEIAEDAGYLVARETCGGATHFDELMRNVAQQIPLLYHGALTPTELQEDKAASFANVIAPEATGPGSFSRVLSEVAGTRVLVVLDEFDRVESEAFERNVAELVKNLSDASARVQFIIAGVAKNLQDLLSYSPSIRRNVVGIPISQMSDAEIQQLITLGEQHTGLPFEPAASADIVSITLGRPYLARLLCHHASLSAIHARRSVVTGPDVSEALDRAVNEMESQLPEQTKRSAAAWLEARPEGILAVARASLLSRKDFGEADLLALDSQSSGDARKLLEQLAASGDLLLTAIGADPPRYTFAEDGLPAYLLLADACSKRAQSLRGGAAPHEAGLEINS